MTENHSTKPRLYGRRKGRPLRLRKSQLMGTLLPQMQFELPAEGFLDLPGLFKAKPAAVWLEIGFGGGEHLAEQALRRPDIGFIGCEPFINGIASLLDHIDRADLKNIRIFPNDARLLLDVLPSQSVARCFVLFPDPWPKVRHAERRFIGSENLVRLARVMTSGAELRLASDDAKLIVWMREIMRDAKEFTSQSDFSAPPTDWVPTRYEQKAVKAGRKPVYFSFLKR